MAFNCTCTCITEHVPESLFSKNYYIQRADITSRTNKECPDALDLPAQKPHQKKNILF